MSKRRSGYGVIISVIDIYLSRCVKLQPMQQDSRTLPARFKFISFVVANVVIALLGTAISATAVGKLIRAHSLSGVLWKEWALSLVCAFFLGFAVRRLWNTSAAKWTWILPSLWFLFRLVPVLLSSGNQSVLAHKNGIWFQLSGLGCEFGMRALDCLNFFVFTIPFIRAVAYSLGAYVAG